MSQTNLLAVLIPAATGLMGLIVGAVVSHMLALKREQAQQKREFNLTYLIDAWRNIYTGSQDHLEMERKAPAMERGITDVMLFGSAKQIEMARVIAQDIVSKKSANPTALLNNLRSDIRQQLNLEKATDQPFFFSLAAKKPTNVQT